MDKKKKDENREREKGKKAEKTRTKYQGMEKGMSDEKLTDRKNQRKREKLNEGKTQRKNIWHEKTNLKKILRSCTGQGTREESRVGRGGERGTQIRGHTSTGHKLGGKQARRIPASESHSAVTN